MDRFFTAAIVMVVNWSWSRFSSKVIWQGHQSSWQEQLFIFSVSVLDSCYGGGEGL